jgi:hypothetical protein
VNVQESNQSQVKDLSKKVARRALVLLLLVGMAWYVHISFGSEIAWWFEVGLAISLIYFSLVLLNYLIRIVIITISTIRLEHEHIKQEQERTTETRLTRLKAEAEVCRARAEAVKAERDSEFAYITARQDEAVFVRDDNENAVWRPLHLIPSHRVNGVDVIPTGMEFATWQYWLADRTTTSSPPTHQQLPLPTSNVALPQRIDLLDLLHNGRGNLRQIVLGLRVDEMGKLIPVTAPIWRLVHIAIGGVTDSGKSNLIRAIAYQVLTATDNVHVILADLKRQSFKPFKQSDKLLYPIITDEVEFSTILAELRAETNRRFTQFETYPAVETLVDYNRASDQALPYLIMFVDEIAGILNGKEIQRDFLHLIQISRAAGIFIISAGQRWSHRIIDTNIRDQYRTRVHFATDDANSSRMLLDSPAASEIELQGRAYAKLPFGIEKSLIEMQAPYLDLDTVLQSINAGNGPQQDMPPPQLDPDTKRVAELVEQNWSDSAIAREVFGTDGGNQIKKVRVIRNNLISRKP